MNSAVAAIVGVAIGALLTGIIQYLLNRQQVAAQIQRENLQHQRDIAARRHDEIKAKYERLLMSGQKLHQVYFQTWRRYQLGLPTLDKTMLETEAGQEFISALALVEIEDGSKDIINNGNTYVIMVDERELLMMTKLVADAPLLSPSEIASAQTALKKAIIKRLRELEAITEA